MNFLIKILVTGIAVVLISYLLPGVTTDNFLVALLVAVVLAVLNVVVKPLLVILTIPITVITLGLFLLVINALIILLTEALIPGFSVDGFWWALLFSLILSLVVAIFDSIF